MIIYGTRAKAIKHEFVTEPCPNCNTPNSIQISVWQKWAHIFWIPFFPIGKTGSSVCAHCRQVLDYRNMPQSLKIAYDNVKADAKLPLWTFSGFGVVAAIVVAIVISDKQTHKRVTGMIPALQKNDLLQIKLKNSAYTLAKVSRVKGDTVFLYLNNYETDQATGIDKLKSKDYSTKEDTLSVDILKQMDAEERILDIER
ncbi:hypothetical protein D0C36_01765 [Mucilaginibacter conchicola]|uniref:Zinc-ribbon domain-containing protein n=1 Tax=Mucilaginibacter conchicola TaxID=2303333 RepID=A0A372NXR0_9SPHI|nr:hypothetical protein [Mucilaginibacter conchicola]RFZ94307.1 hypothetical protein D0C36_01765 [Mucilaginibacter conchicola]